LTPEQVDHLLEELREYHELFSPLFFRKEQRKWAFEYLQGLMSPIPRKSIEPMALHLPAGNVREMQQFIGAGAWDDGALLQRHRALVAESLGEEAGVLIIDGSDFPKKGEESVGVARQYCGATGKVDNCQAGVFLGYAGSRGSTLLDCRLYMPDQWHTPRWRKRRKRCGVPEELEFRTHPELAGDMIEAAREAGTLPGQWVTFDENFGRNPDLLDRVDGLGLWYLAEVPVSTQVWEKAPQTYVPSAPARGRRPTKERLRPGEPKAIRVDELSKGLSPRRWRRYFVKDGEKGVQEAEFAFVRATAVRNKLPGSSVWVVFRRGLEPGSELKIYLSNAPADTPRDEFVRVSGMRWPIETCFREGKEILGMDQYEVRSWRGWHHHMTLVILAHHFLVRLKLKRKKALRH